MTAEGANDMPAKGRTDDEAIGARVRYWREYLGFTQVQIADALKINNKSLCWIEAGKRRLLATEAAKLARIFNVSPEALLEDVDETLARAPAEAEGLPPDDVAELRRFAQFLRYRKGRRAQL